MVKPLDRPKSRKLMWYGGAVLLALFALNYATGEWLRYPVVYCATRGILAPLSAPIFYVFYLAALAVFVVTLFRGKNWGLALLTVLFFAALPMYLETIFLGFLGCGT